jgi:hypothetical protein
MNKLDTMLQVGRTFGVRDGMLRLEYELQRGSGLMSWRMRSVQGWDSWALKKIASETSAEELRTSRRNDARKFFFVDARDLGTNIKRVIGHDGERAVLDEAEKILDGNLPFFGQLSFACGFPPRWFRNPVTGQKVSPEQHWTQMRFASPVYGDLKFILEPSRFLFVYPLLRAYALTCDERFPEAFWYALEDWASNSPPMTGPLWICGQECSLRIIAWSFALHGFIHSPSSTTERVGLLTSMVAAHAWRTAQTVGYARSQRSNHLISEAVGLWTAGTLYPELREAEVWKNLGGHLLREAVLDQLSEAGVSQQHSFNYQRMILHLLLWTLRLAEMQNIALPVEIAACAKAAFDFMRQWVDAISGSAPNYGSNDGSSIFPLSSAGYRDYRPLLQLGAAILDRPAFEGGPWDEAALWFGANPSATEKQTAVSQLSEETGYFRLGDANSWALIRAGSYMRRPFQADQLHVDLWWQGINLARDPGTYLYNGPAPWNNALAGTAVHNTVTIDHSDQMRRAGRFLWLDWAQASGRMFSSPGRTHANRFEGMHDGYRRLGVTHQRTVHWLDGSGWVIVDEIKGSGEHDVRLHWLTPDSPHEIVEHPSQVLFQSVQSFESKSRIRWNIFSSAPGNAAAVRAGALTWSNSPNKFVDADIGLLGWESPTYGDLQPTVSLIYETRSRLPVRLATVILTDERCRVQSDKGQIVIMKTVSMENGAHGESPESEIYRLNLTNNERWSAVATAARLPKA